MIPQTQSMSARPQPSPYINAAVKRAAWMSLSQAFLLGVLQAGLGLVSHWHGPGRQHPPGADCRPLGGVAIIQ